MRILVTGGSGFLGGFVIEELLRRDHDVVALSRSDASARRLEALGVEAIDGDLDQGDTLPKVFASARADALVNLASLGFGHAPVIVAAAIDAGIGRALFVSTTAIFTSLPSASKRVRIAAERTIEQSDLEWTIVRPTMIYGAPGDRNIERLLRLLRCTPIMLLPGGGQGAIQPVHVADLARFVVTALEFGAVRRSFNVAGPEPLALRDAVAEAAKALGRRPLLAPVPPVPVRAVVRAYERVAPRPRLKEEQVLRLGEDKSFDIDDAVSLGYEPRTFAQGVRDEAAALGLVARDSGLPISAVRLGPWLRMVRHLRLSQIAHRLRLRSLRVVDPWLPRYRRSIFLRSAGWPHKFQSIDSQLGWGDAEAIAAGRFTFLSEERALGVPPDWDQRSAARLWRFHLHYFEWAWALAGDRDIETRREDFAKLWRSWSESVPLMHRDAWSPYVASVRAWVLCDVFGRLVRGTSVEGSVVSSLWTHRQFVGSHLELDVGGNHLLKNLKALLGLAAFFGDPSGWERAAGRLTDQIETQVLADGGHFERSPSYHCQVLGDLIDIRGLHLATGLPPVPGIETAIERMQSWLVAMVGDCFELPLFNDSRQVDPERLELLASSRKDDRLTILGPSGYVVVQPAPGVRLVMDTGDPCPPELPAHAHADCLSFELWVDGQRAIVDSGSSTYEPGPRRDLERSTPAHNTVTVDRQDQTEVWGTFRAGRRARGQLEQVEDGETVTIVASHDGYRHLPGSPTHRRELRLGTRKLEVLDVVEGGGIHRIEGAHHLTTWAMDRLKVTVDGEQPDVAVCQVATDFGRLEPAYRLSSAAGPTALPFTIAWVIRW